MVVNIQNTQSLKFRNKVPQSLPRTYQRPLLSHVWHDWMVKWFSNVLLNNELSHRNKNVFSTCFLFYNSLVELLFIFSIFNACVLLGNVVLCFYLILASSCQIRPTAIDKPTVFIQLAYRLPWHLIKVFIPQLVSNSIRMDFIWLNYKINCYCNSSRYKVHINDFWNQYMARLPK